MNEKQEEQVGPPKRKDVLNEMFMAAAGKEESVDYRQKTLDSSNQFLHEYASKLSKEADDHESDNKDDQAKEARQQAIEVMSLVTGGKETIGKGRFREALLVQARDGLVEELSNDLKNAYSKISSKDRKERREGRKEFKKGFKELDPKKRDKNEVTATKIREMNLLIHEVSGKVAKVEGKKGRLSRWEKLKARWRGEIVTPSMARTDMAHWLSERTGINRDVWADPNKLTEVQRELIAEGVDAFSLHRESVVADIDALVEKMMKEGKGEVIETTGAESETTLSDAEEKVVSEVKGWEEKNKKRREKGEKKGFTEEQADQLAKILSGGDASALNKFTEYANILFEGDTEAVKVFRNALLEGLKKSFNVENEGKVLEEINEIKESNPDYLKVLLYLILLQIPEEIINTAKATLAEAAQGAAT